MGRGSGTGGGHRQGGLLARALVVILVLAGVALLHTVSNRFFPCSTSRHLSWPDERRFDGRDQPAEFLPPIEDFDPDEEDPELADDVTFLFAIINMNRRTHLGIENYTFEKDYLEQVKGFLRKYRPEKMQIIIQKRYYPNIQDLLYEGVDVRFVEVEDLRAWKYYESVERIRTSGWWSQDTPWLDNVPQGYSDLYNPIVMHKLLWLRDLSVLNPFKTRYFVWLDSGGICTPRLGGDGGMEIAEFKSKVKHYLDKVLVTLTPYVISNELHGCYRPGMLPVTHDQSPSHIVKGWIMGGNRVYLERVARLYNYVINKSLEMGCLGTEETLLTMAYYRRPDLFHVHHNMEDRANPVPDSDDVCYILWPGEPAQEKDPETPLERYERLKRSDSCARLSARAGGRMNFPLVYGWEDPIYLDAACA